MTSIVYHTSRRIGWRQSRHSLLVDIGSRIEIRLVPLSPSEISGFDHTHVFTRYFEIEIDENRSGDEKKYEFQNIWPVHARRRPDWKIMKFRVRQGEWVITGRIPNQLTALRHQWIYTDDFNMLALTSGGWNDLGTLVSLLTARLHAIAQSVRSDARIVSQFENQQACRDAFGTLFADGIDGAFRNTVLYRQHSTALAGMQHTASALSDVKTICSNHGTVAAEVRQGAGLEIDLDQIGELKDLSWLND